MYVLINNFLPFVLLKNTPFHTIFSKLYLFQQCQSHPYVCKKDLQWSPVEVEKMDDNQLRNSVQSELMSILEFMQEDKKCKYKFSTPKNPFKDLCFYLSYCLLYDFFYTSLFLFSNLSHFRLLDNIFKYTMKKNSTDEKFTKLLSLQVNQDPSKPKVGQCFWIEG